MEKASTRALYLRTGSLLPENEAGAWALLIGKASEARFLGEGLNLLLLKRKIVHFPAGLPDS